MIDRQENRVMVIEEGMLTVDYDGRIVLQFPH
jgi:hypothetical protein